MPRRLPYSQRCELCGRRRLEGSALCYTHERDFDRRWGTVIGKGGQAIGTSGDGSVAHMTPVSRPHNADEEEQDAILRELSRCMYCGFNGGHASDCAGYNDFLDVAEEYDPHRDEDAI